MSKKQVDTTEVTNEIVIPHKFKPRSYQVALLNAMDRGIKRASVVWHRRAGKDKTLINLMVKKMLERVGVYYYFFPTYAQGRKVLWENIDSSGMKLLDHIPAELIQGAPNNTEMKVALKNGSILRIIGTDKYDSIRGTNPAGCVFSEFAYHNPAAWDMVKPILNENGGWAVFNTTPFGKNHAYDLHTMAKDNPLWFSETLTIADTKKDDGTAVITSEMIDEERRSGMSDDMIAQEYYCSFNANITGSYFGKLIDDLEVNGKIGNVPYVPSYPVITAWDLGYLDSTAIWFMQHIGREYRIIDYHESNGNGLDYYAAILNRKPYAYAKHIMPHDIAVTEIGNGTSRKSTALSLGIRPIDIAPKASVADGINSVAVFLPQCCFDAKKCAKGLEALKSYRKEYDEVRKEYKQNPYHDWSSHAADAFRYLATGFRSLRKVEKPMTRKTSII